MPMDLEPIWIGTSWKMNKTLAEAVAFIDEVAAVPTPAGVQPFVLPAATALATVRARLPRDSPILLGAQNAHWAAEGAWTGEVSMRMVADAGATVIEMGHSERREHFGETDGMVAAKAVAAIEHDLTPLICVGEPIGVREAGEADAFIADQVRAALSALTRAGVAACLVAYEPIWAIGDAGRAATDAEIGPVMGAITRTVTEVSAGGRLRALLYGGSVNLDNAAELLRVPHTDGLFVGRTAWRAEGFLQLIQIAADHAKVREMPSS